MSDLATVAKAIGREIALGDVEPKGAWLRAAQAAQAIAWQPIETAPKSGRTLLLYGSQSRPMDDLDLPVPVIFVGYWDPLDSAWCCVGSTWRGPFFDPTHWQPVPEPPR